MQEDADNEKFSNRSDQPLYCALSEKEKVFTICVCSLVIFLGPIANTIHVSSGHRLAGERSTRVDFENLFDAYDFYGRLEYTTRYPTVADKIQTDLSSDFIFVVCWPVGSDGPSSNPSGQFVHFILRGLYSRRRLRYEYGRCFRFHHRPRYLGRAGEEYLALLAWDDTRSSDQPNSGRPAHAVSGMEKYILVHGCHCQCPTPHDAISTLRNMSM